MKTRTKIITALTATLAIGISGLAMAKDHDKRGGGMMGEAFVAACANQTEGANVTLDHPMWGQVNAVCAKSPKDGKLVAMPAKMVERMKQAQAACDGKAEGDKVTINGMRDGKTMEATCKKHGDILAARPEHKGMWHKDGDKKPAAM